MLFLDRAIKSSLHKPQTSELAALTTEWGERLDAEHPLAEHPKPQMQRERWISLNGVWDYAFVVCDDPAAAWRDDCGPEEYDGSIVVPFSPEAPLSSVGKRPPEDAILVESRDLRLPALGPGECAILHFEAVDWACSVWLNGKKACEHVGGYTPFSCDITPFLEDGPNRLSLSIYDPSEKGVQLRGKQRIDRGTMWYTAQSGIWQSVWCEIVPEQHIERLEIAPDADAALLKVRAAVSEGDAPLEVEVLDGGLVVAQATGSVRGVELALGSVRLWSPDDPHLYDLIVRYGDDTVRSYCAFRTAMIEPDERGHERFCLNHEPLFLRGILNQGYWPDGLLTAPSDEALVFDIETCKRLGFNMMRMHIKLERERFYYHADCLGMLIWQDMVSGGSLPSDWQTQQKPTLFPRSWTSIDDSRPAAWVKLAAGDRAYREEWTATVHEAVLRLSAHPSIVTWVLFNESWGQFSAGEATRMVRALDPTRPILSVSGWYDQGTGDYMGIHNYFRPQRIWRDAVARPRAFMISEFGGLTWHIPEHSSFPKPYGYADFTSIGAWRAALSKLLSDTRALERDGLSGYVYTQVSDIEEETNGLMSYDRRIIKLETDPIGESGS